MTSYNYYVVNKVDSLLLKGKTNRAIDYVKLLFANPAIWRAILIFLIMYLKSASSRIYIHLLSILNASEGRVLGFMDQIVMYFSVP